MVEPKVFGRLMRVEVVDGFRAGTGEPVSMHDEIINLDHVIRIYRGKVGARFVMTDGAILSTTEHFETVSLGSMFSEVFPRPPKSRGQLEDEAELQQEWDEYIGSLR